MEDKKVYAFFSYSYEMNVPGVQEHETDSSPKKIPDTYRGGFLTEKKNEKKKRKGCSTIPLGLLFIKFSNPA